MYGDGEGLTDEQLRESLMALRSMKDRTDDNGNILLSRKEAWALILHLLPAALTGRITS